METMIKLFPTEKNVFSLQKCWVSRLCSENVHFALFNNQYIVIPLLRDVKCICKVFLKNNIPPNSCVLDTSVLMFNDITEDVNSLFSTSWDMKLIPSKSITIVKQILQIKSITLSVVFDEVEYALYWRVQMEELCDILKDILKLYVVANNSVIYLSSAFSHRIGIRYIIVHSIGSGDVGKTVSKTRISIRDIVSKQRYTQAQQKCSMPLGGLDKPIKVLKDIIHSVESLERNNESRNFILSQTKQILIVGPRGCGKTSLVYRIAAEHKIPLMRILGPEVYKSGPGDTERELRYLFRKAVLLTKESGTCILLLDEIDILCPKRGSSTHVTRTATQLLLLLEEVCHVEGLIIIATSSQPQVLDPAARRPGRFELEIYIGVPTEEERTQIFEVLLKPSLSDNEHLMELCKQLAYITPGYVGADISLICHQALFQMYKTQDSASSIERLLNYFKAAVTKIRPSALRGGFGVVSAHCMSLSEIGGLEDVKKTLTTAIKWPLLHPVAFQTLGVPQPKGILLYGPPGCAKTSIARALASDIGTTFLSVSAAELYSPYFGDAEKNIVELFHRARLGAPSVLFIDEIDAIVGSRGYGNFKQSVQERVLSTLLTEMDGVGLKVEADTSEILLKCQREKKGNHVTKFAGTYRSPIIIVAATNRPDMLDDALLRPGRFDKLIYIPPPDESSRLDILKVVTEKMPIGPDVNLKEIAQCTGFFSGADLANLCREAALCALTQDGMDAQKINARHFQYAMNIVKGSLNEKLLSWYQNFQGK